MAGKRALDAAKLFNATRSVAEKHVGIRSQQLDTWSKTSTVARSLKSQTSRVTLTAQAAIALAQRFGDSPPTHSTGPSQTQYSRQHDFASQTRAQASSNTETGPREGIEQDHHYKREQGNSTSQIPPQSEIDLTQKKADRLPTADGSIPPAGAPLDVTGASPENAGRDKSNEDVEAPEGVDTEVFHSPRIKQMLGRDKKAGDQSQTGGYTSLEDNGKEGSQDKFSTTPQQADAYGPSARVDNVQSGTKQDESQEINNLASDIGKEAQLLQSASNRVCLLQYTLRESWTDSLTVCWRKNEMFPSESVSASNPYKMHESRVPSSRAGRLWQYSGLATSMAFGAVSETFRRVTGGAASGSSLMVSAGNMERLVAKLSKMRGAALKLGQMMSFQGTLLESHGKSGPKKP